MTDYELELIESFWDDEIDQLVDVYWNGRYGHAGICRAKVMAANVWRDEYTTEDDQ